jgi:hypothetical protein
MIDVVKMVWEREYTSFSSVAAVARKLVPSAKSMAASAAFLTSMYVSPRTEVLPSVSSTMSKLSCASSSSTRLDKALGGRGGRPLEGLEPALVALFSPSAATRY